MRITSGGVVQCGLPTATAQSIAKLSSRVNGAAIEFGHTNNSGQYYGTLGSFGSNGSPYIGFSTFCESGVNTFTTNGAAGNIIVSDAGSLKFQQVTTATATGQTPTTRMTIDSNGDITGQGAITAVGNLNATGTESTFNTGNSGQFIMSDTNSYPRITLSGASAQLGLFRSNSSAGGMYIGGDSNGFQIRDDAFATKMQVSDSGKVTIGGTPDTNYALYVIDAQNRTQGTSQFHINGSGYSAFHWLDATAYYINQNSTIRSLRIYSGTSGGVELAAGGTSWGTFSDETEKENIKPLDNVLDKIKDYRCVKFNFKEDESKETKIGFIAQDWENDFAETVYKSKNKKEEEKLAMKYTETIPVLLKAIQELKAEVDELKKNCNCK